MSALATHRQRLRFPRRSAAPASVEIRRRIDPFPRDLSFGSSGGLARRASSGPTLRPTEVWSRKQMSAALACTEEADDVQIRQYPTACGGGSPVGAATRAAGSGPTTSSPPGFMHRHPERVRRRPPRPPAHEPLAPLCVVTPSLDQARGHGSTATGANRCAMTTTSRTESSACREAHIRAPGRAKSRNACWAYP